MKRIRDLKLGDYFYAASYGGDRLVWQLVSKFHQGDPNGSARIFCRDVIKIMCFDASEPKNPNNASYGRNNPRIANLTQWANKDGLPNEWYEDMHDYDAPPIAANTGSYNPYMGIPAMMNGWTQLEKEAFLTVSVPYRVISATGNGDPASSNLFYDAKFFPPSALELGIAGYNPSDRESIVEYFAQNTASTFKRRLLAQSAIRENNYPNLSSTLGGAFVYWTRSPVADNIMVIAITAAGGASQYTANLSNAGFAPMACMSLDQRISDEPDEHGIYSVILNVAPEISGADTHLGKLDISFSTQLYTATDENNEKLTITEKIKHLSTPGETILRTHEVISGEEQQFSIPKDQWQQIPNGTHQAIIEADDGEFQVQRKYTFHKDEDVIDFKRAKSLPADDMPGRGFIALTPQPTADDDIKVYACNNANDENPTEEDVTAAVIGKRGFLFGNKNKTAEDWGIGVHVIWRRKGNTKCYIDYMSIAYGAATATDDEMEAFDIPLGGV